MIFLALSNEELYEVIETGMECLYPHIAIESIDIQVGNESVEPILRVNIRKSAYTESKLN